MASQEIRYLSNDQIDREKWDRCISGSPNGLIYAYSFFLNCTADNWDALVLGDYEAVMPLTWRKKYGVRYIYQPFLTAQLGLFGKQVSSVLLKEFLEAIPSKYKFWDFPLNHGNLFAPEGFNILQRMNYVLDLSGPYEEIYRVYRENVQRNIRKANQYKCQLKKDFPVEEVYALTAGYHHRLEENEYRRFAQLFRQLAKEGKAVTYGIGSVKGELLASAAFLFSHQRAYYLLVGNHPDGKTLGASHAVVDAFIRDHAGSELTLDFEGSDIRNLAFFYSSFGAREEKYATIRMNRLPFFLRWMKPQNHV